MQVVVATFNQEKALVGAFSVITNLRVDLRFPHIEQLAPGIQAHSNQIQKLIDVAQLDII